MFKETNTTLLPVGVPPAFLPGAFYNPLPNATKGRLMTPKQILLHTNAGEKTASWRNLFGFAHRSYDTGAKGITQPHLQINLDGEIGQGLPFDRMGVHAVKANSFAVGIETADFGTKVGEISNQPWTNEQIESMVRAATHICIFYNIPAKLATTWDGPGISWHAQFGYPYTSLYKGKTCPGRARISQVLEVVVKVHDNVETVKRYFGK